MNDYTDSDNYAQFYEELETLIAGLPAPFNQLGHIENMARRVGLTSLALRLLTEGRMIDHFSALALIKTGIAGRPTSRPWQFI